MRKLKHHKRRRPRKQLAKRTTTPTVEALEPRLVLAAVGFGFEGARMQLDFHARDDGNRDANQSAFAQRHHNVRGNERFEFANREELDFNRPAWDSHAQGGRANERFTESFFEPNQRGPRFNDQPGRPIGFGGAEGEASDPTDGFEEVSSYQPVDDTFEPNRTAEYVMPRTTVVFILLSPTTSPARGDELRDFGQSTRLTQPPRSSFANPVSQPGRSAATLSVELPVSIQLQPTARSIDSPILGFNSPPSLSVAASVVSANESAKAGDPDFASFVSFTTSNVANWWNANGTSIDSANEAVGPLSESIRPAAATEAEIVSARDSINGRLDRLTEESLWDRVSEGGFIDIDTDAVENSRTRVEFVEDVDEASISKRLRTQSPRDAFWFDFSETRFDLMFDSSAVHKLAEEQAAGDAANADEEAWLLDDGGMIVLTNGQSIDQLAEMAVDDSSELSPTSETTSGEIEISMDAGIGVFQAIEVASAPIGQQGKVQTSDDTPAPIEREATAGTGDVTLPAEQAARNSDSELSVPIRAASMPLLLAFAALFARGRKDRKKITDQEREV